MLMRQLISLSLAKLFVFLADAILRVVGCEQFSRGLKIDFLQFNEVIEMGGVFLKETGRASQTIPDLALGSQADEINNSIRMVLALAGNVWEIRFLSE